MPFTVGYFPFYSAILGFLGYHWFPLFALLVTRTNVVSATSMDGPFLILHYFILLIFSLRKTPTDLPIQGYPRGLTFGLSSFNTFKFYLFRPNFWLLFLLLFFPSELILSCQDERSLATFPYGSSSWVPRGTGPLLMGCWFLSLMTPFLHNWVADRDISILVPCVS